jgi:hypothetical protein
MVGPRRPGDVDSGPVLRLDQTLLAAVVEAEGGDVGVGVLLQPDVVAGPRWNNVAPVGPGGSCSSSLRQSSGQATGIGGSRDDCTRAEGSSCR